MTGVGESYVKLFQDCFHLERTKGGSVLSEAQFRMTGALLFKGDQSSEHGHCSEI